MAVAPIPFKTANLTFENMHYVVTSSKKLELLKGSSSGEGKTSLIEDSLARFVMDSKKGEGRTLFHDPDDGISFASTHFLNFDPLIRPQNSDEH